MQMPKSKYVATEDLSGSKDGGQAEDADNSSEDEYLTQGQHFGIFHSDSVTEDTTMSEKQLLAQLSVPKERTIVESLSRIAQQDMIQLQNTQHLVNIHPLQCENEAEKMLRDLFNYGCVRNIHLGELSKEEYIEVQDIYGSWTSSNPQ